MKSKSSSSLAPHQKLTCFRKYLGFFDISDVLAVVYGVDLLRHLFPISQLKEQTVDIHGIKLDLSYSEDARGVDLPVSKMMQVDGHMAPWWPVQPNSLLIDVVKRLAAKVDAPWSSCRRVPVIDPKTGRVVKIISQSEIVNRMYANVVSSGQLEPLFIQTPRTHKLGLCQVRFVDGTKETARKAFEIIINMRVSAVPVVDATGALVGSITNKDIFLLESMRNDQQGKFRFDELLVCEFMQKANEYCKANGRKPRPPVGTVTVDTPIHIIIKELAEKKTHRVFILDDAKKPPVGVVSVSDVVKLMLDEGLPWPSDVLVHHLVE